MVEIQDEHFRTSHSKKSEIGLDLAFLRLLFYLGEG